MIKVYIHEPVAQGFIAISKCDVPYGVLLYKWHTHTHSLSHAHSLYFTHTYSLCLSLSLTNTHTHRAHPHTHSRTKLIYIEYIDILEIENII